MTNSSTTARELPEREARRALREQFHLQPDFEDTCPGWDIEPTEAESVRAALGENL